MFNYPIETLISDLKEVSDACDLRNDSVSTSTIDKTIDLIITMFELLNKEN